MFIVLLEACLSEKTRACSSRVYSDNHILEGRQRGQNAVTNHLDRLKTALADRYAIERAFGAGAMATVYLPGDRREPQKDAEHVAD